MHKEGTKPSFEASMSSSDVTRSPLRSKDTSDELEDDEQGEGVGKGGVCGEEEDIVESSNELTLGGKKNTGR